MLLVPEVLVWHTKFQFGSFRAVSIIFSLLEVGGPSMVFYPMSTEYTLFLTNVRLLVIAEIAELLLR